MVGRRSSSAIGIVTRVRWDEPSSALLQSGRFDGVPLSRDVNRRLLLAPAAGSRVSTVETAPILRAPRPAHGEVATCRMWFAMSSTSTTLPSDLCGLSLPAPDPRQQVRSISTVSNRREWMTGYTAAANTSTNTAAIPVRSDSSGTPQAILMP
jgi:hypothetical protein